MSVLGNYNVVIDVNAPAHSDKIAQPPKKWRNWYKTKNAFFCMTTGPHKVGDVFRGSNVWPTKDIAETKALHTSTSSAVIGNTEYLGAEPEPDAN